jgi:hypothetical protein
LTGAATKSRWHIGDGKSQPVQIPARSSREPRKSPGRAGAKPDYHIDGLHHGHSGVDLLLLADTVIRYFITLVLGIGN